MVGEGAEAVGLPLGSIAQKWQRLWFMTIEPMAGLKSPPMDTLCWLLFKKEFFTRTRKKLRLSGLGACPTEAGAATATGLVTFFAGGGVGGCGGAGGRTTLSRIKLQ